MSLKIPKDFMPAKPAVIDGEGVAKKEKVV
jgi:hypothetical protein